MFRLKLHVSVNISVNSQRHYHKPPQTMTWTTTNDDMNHHKSLQNTTSLPWHESPQIINHYKSPQTMTQTTMNHDRNQYKAWHESLQITTNHDMNHHDDPKELCIKPYGFLVRYLISWHYLDIIWDTTWYNFISGTNRVIISTWIFWDYYPSYSFKLIGRSPDTRVFSVLCKTGLYSYVMINILRIHTVPVSL